MVVDSLLGMRGGMGEREAGMSSLSTVDQSVKAAAYS